MTFASWKYLENLREFRGLGISGYGRQPVDGCGIVPIEQIEELEICVHFDVVSELETPRYAGIQIDKAWRDEVIAAAANRCRVATTRVEIHSVEEVVAVNVGRDDISGKGGAVVEAALCAENTAEFEFPGELNKSIN